MSALTLIRSRVGKAGSTSQITRYVADHGWRSRFVQHINSDRELEVGCRRWIRDTVLFGLAHTQRQLWPMTISPPRAAASRLGELEAEVNVGASDVSSIYHSFDLELQTSPHIMTAQGDARGLVGQRHRATLAGCRGSSLRTPVASFVLRFRIIHRAEPH
jgi:hypothetical protein